MRVIVTGGAGFIGSAVIRHAINQTKFEVLNLDKLTYAGNLESLHDVTSSPRYQFRKVDICNRADLDQTFAEYKPDGVMHLAAESHVDRSIDDPGAFIRTNALGTYELLEATRRYFKTLPQDKKAAFRFHHVSTDEVYGTLQDNGYFSENSAYAPNSPYSSSKASADMLVRAWHHTYKLPVVTTNCSNNFGPYHFPEKLIPLMILNALEGKKLPVYGTGANVRDWLYVEDHARCLWEVYKRGRIGETYLIGGRSERTNLQVVETICDLLDEAQPRKDKSSYRDLISFVTDRPGHDFRYAIDCSKVEKELGWRAQETFDSAMRKTVSWYIGNKDGWCKRVQDGSYQRERLGHGD